MAMKLNRVCNRCGGTGRMADGSTTCTQCGKVAKTFTKAEVREMNVDTSKMPYIREYDMNVVEKYPKAKELFMEVATGFKPERPCYMLVENQKDQLKLSNRFTTVAYGNGWGRAVEPLDAYTLNQICKPDYVAPEGGITKQEVLSAGALVIMLSVDKIFETIDNLRYVLRMRRMTNKTTFIIADLDFVEDMRGERLKDKASVKQFRKLFVTPDNWTEESLQNGEICVYADRLKRPNANSITHE